jgi:hypothetical protein
MQQNYGVHRSHRPRVPTVAFIWNLTVLKAYISIPLMLYRMTTPIV